MLRYLAPPRMRTSLVVLALMCTVPVLAGQASVQIMPAAASQPTTAAASRPTTTTAAATTQVTSHPATTQAASQPATAAASTEPPLTPEQIEAKQQMDAINAWWENNWQYFAWIGGIVLAIAVSILGTRLIRWVKEEPSEDVDEGDPLSSGGAGGGTKGGGPGGGTTEVVTTEELVEVSRPRQTTFRCGTLLYTKKALIMVFAWLLWGDFCFYMMESIANSALSLKFKDLGASNTTMGLVLLTIPSIFSFVIHPSVSVWSDRTRTKWGRRLPFIMTTLPFLTMSLVLMAYCDDIGLWIQHAFYAGTAVDKAKVIIVVLSVSTGLFQISNLFLNTVYWYLFNDVVPQEMMGRFMAYFRLVSTLTTMVFSFFIYKYALIYMKELYLGAAILYAVGFGVMCLSVKESQYPPPEDAGPNVSFGQKVKHMLESLSISHYVYFTLEPTVQMLASGVWGFAVFANLSMGLTLGNIGIMGGIGSLMGLGYYMFVGQLVDRWNSVRVYAYIGAMGPFVCAGAWTWLFVAHPNPLVFMLTIVIGQLFMQPSNSIASTAGMPRCFALLPREKTGQYIGVAGMVKASGQIASGLFAGLYLDTLQKFVPAHPGDPNWVYRYSFILTALSSIGMGYCNYKVYRGWKRMGGDKSYVPPVKQFRLRDLPPHPDTNGKVNWALLAFAFVYIVGVLICSVIWIVYYYWWHYNAYNLMIFTIALGINIALAIAYVCFVKFMERR